MIIDENNMSSFLEKLAETLSENSKKDKSHIQFESFPLFQNECLYVFDFSQKKIIFKQGFQNVLGYQDHEITIDFITGLYHPDEAGLINRIIQASILYCLEYPENSSNNLLFLSFQLRKKDGTYIKILSQSYIYDIDKNGQISSVLIRFTD
ncbi:MAG: PAS domain-containing protein, partial [Bacteroidota bacterium]